MRTISELAHWNQVCTGWPWWPQAGPGRARARSLWRHRRASAPDPVFSTLLGSRSRWPTLPRLVPEATTVRILLVRVPSPTAPRACAWRAERRRPGGRFRRCALDRFPAGTPGACRVFATGGALRHARSSDLTKPPHAAVQPETLASFVRVGASPRHRDRSEPQWTQKDCTGRFDALLIHARPPGRPQRSFAEGRAGKLKVMDRPAS